MKRFLLFIAVSITAYAVNAQTPTNTFPSTGSAGIGTTKPDTSALLEMKSIKKGLLIPRMTVIQRNAIVTPAIGLLIYQINSTPGFYYRNDTGWVALSPYSANTSLSNLNKVAVNKPFLPDSANRRNIGNITLPWASGYFMGKMAVGTTDTSAKMNIGGNIKIVDGTQGNGKVLTSDGNGLASWKKPTTQWAVSGNDIYNSNSGNVGIGTTTPADKLTVYNTGYGFTQTDGAVTVGSYVNSAAGWFGTKSNSPLYFFTNDGDVSVALNTDGNFGIGTDAPAAKLDVAGQIKIVDGTQGAGKVLTSDANGLASWSNLPTLTIQQQQANEIADLKTRIAKLEALIGAQTATVSNQNVTISSAAVASLKQNVPNPFSSTTVISYTLPQHISNAAIVVTDVQGNTLKTITVTTSGSVTVAAGSLASGTYKYSLLVDGRMIDTKTMVLTK